MTHANNHRQLAAIAAEDQATAAAAPLLSVDPRTLTVAEQDAARRTLGAAKLAIRRAALAAGLIIDPLAGKHCDRATLARLRPYTDALQNLNYWQERRELDDGAARRAEYDRRRAAAGRQ
jgi:hypothetical protein